MSRLPALEKHRCPYGLGNALRCCSMAKGAPKQCWIMPPSMSPLCCELSLQHPCSRKVLLICLQVRTQKFSAGQLGVQARTSLPVGVRARIRAASVPVLHARDQNGL